MAEVKKQKAEAPKKAPAKKAEVKQEPAAKPEKKCENTMVKEIFGSKNAIFMLNIVDVALAAAYFIAFLVTMVVLLATNAGYGWLNIVCQVLSVLLFAVLFVSNYITLRPSFKFKNMIFNCVVEVIVEILIIVLAYLGFKSAFVIVAVLPQLIISAIEIGLAYKVSKQ